MRRAVALLAALAIGGATRVARADDKAVAETLYEEAQALIKAGRHAEACPKLVDSQRLDPGIGTALYLGDCWEHVHKLASAWGSYREAASLAERQGDPKRVDVARRHADALAPRLSRITLAFAAGVDTAGVEVRRAGKLVLASELGSAIPIDGGTYELVVTAPHRAPWRTSVVVPEQSANLTVRLEVGANEAPNPPPLPLTTSATAETRAAGPAGPYWTPLRVAGLVGLGLGVGGLAIGVTLGLVAKGDFDGSNRPGRCDAATNLCTPEGLRIRSDAKALADVGTAAFVIGGALAAGGLALVLLAPRGRAAIVPAGAGAAIVGRF